MRKTAKELEIERMARYNSLSKYAINDIRNEMMDKIANHLSKKFYSGFHVSNLYDTHQNYCVRIDNPDMQEKVKAALREIGAKKFRVVQKTHICFWIEDGLPVNVH